MTRRGLGRRFRLAARRGQVPRRREILSSSAAMRGRYRAQRFLKTVVRPVSLRGHTSVPAAFSIAAAPADEPFFGVQPGDPRSPSGPIRASSGEPEAGDLHLRRSAGSSSPDGPGARRAESPTSPRPTVCRRPVRLFSPFYGVRRGPHAAAIAALVCRQPRQGRGLRSQRLGPPPSTSRRRAGTSAPAAASCAPTSSCAARAATPSPM